MKPQSLLARLEGIGLGLATNATPRDDPATLVASPSKPLVPERGWVDVRREVVE